MKTSRRILLCAALFVYLLCVLFPAPAAKAERGEPEEGTAGLRGGDSVLFGRCEQDNEETCGPEPIEWIVLDVRDGKALLLSRYGLDTRLYNRPKDNNPRLRQSKEQLEKNAAITWEKSYLREWLNGGFYQSAFSAPEKRAILLTDVSNDNAQGCSEYDTSGGKDTQDYVFLLSWHEAFEQYLTDKENLAAEPAAFALNKNAVTRQDKTSGRITGSWWLRSPGSKQSQAAVVDESGSLVSRKTDERGILIRPAIWVDAGAGYFSSSGRRACPECGAPGSMHYCTLCGAVNPEEAAAVRTESTEGRSRIEGSIQPFPDAGVMAQRYGTAEGDPGFVYEPGDPQPMNAVLIAGDTWEVPVENTLASFRNLMGQERTSAEKYLSHLAELIEEESSGLIRFVPDPDRADLMITVSVSYKFYKTYQPMSGEGETVDAYSCRVGAEALSLPDPSVNESFSVTENPPNVKFVSAGADRFYAERPKMDGSKKVTAFAENILRWYGYCPEGALDENVRAEGVRRAQQELKNRGFFAGETDGAYNGETEFGIRKLQAAHGLPVNGILDRSTMTALYYPADFRPEEAGAGDARMEDPFVCEGCGWIYERAFGYKYCPNCGTRFLPSNLNAGGVENGTTVFFGRYEQDNNFVNGPEPIEWTVADGKDGMVMLLSRYGLDAGQYHEIAGEVTWEDCTLRAWLNGEFYTEAFSESEKNAVVLTKVNNDASGKNPDWNTQDDPDTEDRVFLLSWKEAEETVLQDKADRLCRYTEYARWRGVKGYGGDTCRWWLRSPAYSWGGSSAIDLDGGSKVVHNDWNEVGVRPVVWVRTDAEIFGNGLTEYMPEKPEGQTFAALPDVRAGNRTVFGNYEQDGDKTNGTEPIEWIVLETRENKALLLSAYGLDAYGNAKRNTTWEKITLRNWLNEDFFAAAFSAEEQSAILTTETDNSAAQANPNWKYKKSKNTTDKVFVLSWAEAEQYLPHPSLRMCAPTAYAIKNKASWKKDILTPAGEPAGAWWLRLQGSGGDELVTADGGYLCNGKGSSSYTSFAVRPAVWVDLTSPVF